MSALFSSAENKDIERDGLQASFRFRRFGEASKFTGAIKVQWMQMTAMTLHCLLAENRLDSRFKNLKEPFIPRTYIPAL